MRRLPFLIMLVALLGPGNAWARSADGADMQVDHFEPHYGQGTAVLNALTTRLLPHLRPTFGAFFHTSYGLVEQTRELADGSEVAATTVLGLSYKLELSAGLGLWDVLDLGVTVPLVIDQDFESGRLPTLPARTEPGNFNVQDLRVGARLRLLNALDTGGFGLGLGATLYVPTGDTTQFTTDDDFRVEPKLIVDWRHDSGFALGLNAGVQFRPERRFYNVVSDTAFRWNVFTEIPLGVEGLDLLGTVFGTVPFTTNLDPADLTATSNDVYDKPVEVLGGLRYWWYKTGLVFQLGGGAGLTEGMGAPAWRAFASIDFTPHSHDRDGDGIADSDDQCPDDPEDFDTFEDADGCPDVDNDKDGVLDVDDRCPLDPEDKDGFQDADGCPDPDNDQDGVLDADDRCPLDPEDKDSFQDEDGCPDPDNDQDGILDVDDRCPLEPEDKDGFEDEDGCPDPDNDNDQILDVDDLCPNRPETKNDFEDEDGCPDDPKAKVHVTKKYITIRGKVNFATAKAKLRGKKTFELLDEVARVLNEYPQITKLRIEGHTDSRGSAKSNLALSDRRAASVRTYLIGKGVDPNRLVAKGYGEERPKVPNKGRKNMAINRRTEFFILEINGRPVAPDAKVEDTKRSDQGDSK